MDGFFFELIRTLYVADAEETLTPPSLADGVGWTSSGISTSGAKLGDFVLVSAPYDLQGLIAIGYVSGNNTVKIRLQNETGGVISLASGKWRIKVIRL